MRPTLLYSIISSIVAFSLTPKYMTLNGYFTSHQIFTITNSAFRNDFTLFSVEPIYRTAAASRGLFATARLISLSVEDISRLVSYV